MALAKNRIIFALVLGLVLMAGLVSADTLTISPPDYTKVETTEMTFKFSIDRDLEEGGGHILIYTELAVDVTAQSLLDKFNREGQEGPLRDDMFFLAYPPLRVEKGEEYVVRAETAALNKLDQLPDGRYFVVFGWMEPAYEFITGAFLNVSTAEEAEETQTAKSGFGFPAPELEPFYISKITPDADGGPSADFVADEDKKYTLKEEVGFKLEITNARSVEGKMSVYSNRTECPTKADMKRVSSLDMTPDLLPFKEKTTIDITKDDLVGMAIPTGYPFATFTLHVCQFAKDKDEAIAFDKITITPPAAVPAPPEARLSVEPDTFMKDETNELTVTFVSNQDLDIWQFVMGRVKIDDLKNAEQYANAVKQLQDDPLVVTPIKISNLKTAVGRPVKKGVETTTTISLDPTTAPSDLVKELIKKRLNFLNGLEDGIYLLGLFTPDPADGLKYITAGVIRISSPPLKLYGTLTVEPDTYYRDLPEDITISYVPEYGMEKYWIVISAESGKTQASATLKPVEEKDLDVILRKMNSGEINYYVTEHIRNPLDDLKRKGTTTLSAKDFIRRFDFFPEDGTYAVAIMEYTKTPGTPFGVYKTTKFINVALLTVSAGIPEFQELELEPSTFDIIKPEPVKIKTFYPQEKIEETLEIYASKKIVGTGIKAQDFLKKEILGVAAPATLGTLVGTKDGPLEAGPKVELELDTDALKKLEEGKRLIFLYDTKREKIIDYAAGFLTIVKKKALVIEPDTFYRGQPKDVTISYTPEEEIGNYMIAVSAIETPDKDYKPEPIIEKDLKKILEKMNAGEIDFKALGIIINPPNLKQTGTYTMSIDFIKNNFTKDGTYAIAIRHPIEEGKFIDVALFTVKPGLPEKIFEQVKVQTLPPFVKLVKKLPCATIFECLAQLGQEFAKQTFSGK